jgi:hypothetical protein
MSSPLRSRGRGGARCAASNNHRCSYDVNNATIGELIMKIRNTLIGAALALPLMSGMVFAGDSFWRQSTGVGSLTTTNGIHGSYAAGQSENNNATVFTSVNKGAGNSVSQAYAAVFVPGKGWKEKWDTGNRVCTASTSQSGTGTTWQGRIQNQ